jgi:hypothetical protein
LRKDKKKKKEKAAEFHEGSSEMSVLDQEEATIGVSGPSSFLEISLFNCCGAF